MCALKILTRTETRLRPEDAMKRLDQVLACLYNMLIIGKWHIVYEKR